MKVKMGRRIGILGGTFNPVHNGHLQIAECAYRYHDLDEVWFLPNFIPPHKQFRENEIHTDERLEMLKLAVKDISYFKICMIEQELGGTSYTYETMEELVRRYPEDRFLFLIGADSLFQFHSWKNPERISKCCGILAAYRSAERPDENCRSKEGSFNRRHASKEKNLETTTKQDFMDQIRKIGKDYQVEIHPIEMPLYDISSTDIRLRVSAGESIRELVPSEVEEYIIKHRLYQDE